MKRNPHVEDYNRKIHIVFFNILDEIFEKYKSYFPKEYYMIRQEESLEEISTTLYNEVPDLVVLPEHIQVLSDRMEGMLLYIEKERLEKECKEVSTMIRKKAYENYIIKIKKQIGSIIRSSGYDIDKSAKKIVNLLDLKNTYFRDHSIRVAKYSMQVGEKLQLKEEELVKLKYASLLHDIGILALPSSIVSKPGEYSKFENTFYKYHTLMGDFLLNFPLFKEIKRLVRLHHERIDGKGFLKKKEEEIPLCCKIIFICDTFDLLVTSNLFYPRMSYKEAFEKLSSLSEKKKINRKKRFEKSILDVFIEIMQGEREFPDMNEIVKNL